MQHPFCKAARTARWRGARGRQAVGRWAGGAPRLDAAGAAHSWRPCTVAEFRCYFFTVVLLRNVTPSASPKLIIHFEVRGVFEKADSWNCCLTDMEAHILEAQLTKGRVSNSPCYKAETWDNSFCETPKALLRKKTGDNIPYTHHTVLEHTYRIPIKTS